MRTGATSNMSVSAVNGLANENNGQMTLIVNKSAERRPERASCPAACAVDVACADARSFTVTSRVHKDRASRGGAKIHGILG